MKKVSVYKCPHCTMKYRDLDGWNSHVLEMHKDKIPEGFTPSRYFYYILTGKGLDGPYCPICHRPNPWNENTLKYAKYCGNEKCRKELAKIAKANMMKKYGKEHLMNDPDYQKNMLKHRRISGTYTFSDGNTFDYTGSYEKDFLQMLDTFMRWPTGDLMAPSPNVYKYQYDGKEHFYIPDFYIPSLKLELEIKDGGDNPNMHHKIQSVDKVKEANKDKVLNENPNVNYLKLVNKEYTDFFEFLLKNKEEGIVLETSLPTIDNINPDYSEYDKTLQKIITFNIKLSNMEYIIPNNGNIITKIKANDFINYYKMLTPKEFYKYNGGVCWDYVAAQAEWFNKNNIKYHTYYNICDDGNECPTHTYSIIKYNNYYYWFEASWKPMHGIYKFKTEKDAINYVSSKLYIHAKSNAKKIYGIYNIEFNPLDSDLFGRNCEDYMEYHLSTIRKTPSKYKWEIINNPKEPLEVITEPLSYESVMTGYSPIVPYYGTIRKPGMEDYDEDIVKKKRRKIKLDDSFIHSYESIIEDLFGKTIPNLKVIPIDNSSKNKFIKKDKTLNNIYIADDEICYILLDAQKNMIGYFVIEKDKTIHPEISSTTQYRFIKYIHVTNINENAELSLNTLMKSAIEYCNANAVSIVHTNKDMINLFGRYGFKYVNEDEGKIIMIL